MTAPKSLWKDTEDRRTENTENRRKGSRGVCLRVLHKETNPAILYISEEETYLYLSIYIYIHIYSYIYFSSNYIRENTFPAWLGCYSASALENEVILPSILPISKQQSELLYCFPITQVIFGNTLVIGTMTWAMISLCCWSTLRKLLLSMFKWRLYLVTYWLLNLCILDSIAFIF